MSKKMYEQFACSRMMLPEHRQELNRRIKKLQQEEENRYPVFDEQEWEEFEHLLDQSMNFCVKITLTVREGMDDSQLITGVVQKKLPLLGQIEIMTGGKVQILISDDILKIEKS